MGVSTNYWVVGLSRLTLCKVVSRGRSHGDSAHKLVRTCSWKSSHPGKRHGDSEVKRGSQLCGDIENPTKTPNPSRYAWMCSQNCLAPACAWGFRIQAPPENSGRITHLLVMYACYADGVSVSLIAAESTSIHHPFCRVKAFGVVNFRVLQV